MVEDSWLPIGGIIATVIGGIILIFVKKGSDSLLSYIVKRIKRTPKNVFTKIETPPEIEIGSFERVYATFKGTLIDGFITCRIVDSHEHENWCEDKTTVMNLEDGSQIGTLKLDNEERKFSWLIRPEPKVIHKGKGRLEIHAYSTMERHLIDWKKNDVLLV